MKKNVKMQKEPKKNTKIVKDLRKVKELKIVKGIKAVKVSAAVCILCLFAVSGLHQGYAYFSGTSEMKVNHLFIVKGEQDQEGGLERV